jgi:hypothetical protein
VKLTKQLGATLRFARMSIPFARRAAKPLLFAPVNSQFQICELCRRFPPPMSNFQFQISNSAQPFGMRTCHERTRKLFLSHTYSKWRPDCPLSPLESTRETTNRQKTASASLVDSTLSSVSPPMSLRMNTYEKHRGEDSPPFVSPKRKGGYPTRAAAQCGVLGRSGQRRVSCSQGDTM